MERKYEQEWLRAFCRECGKQIRYQKVCVSMSGGRGIPSFCSMKCRIENSRKRCGTIDSGIKGQSAYVRKCQVCGREYITKKTRQIYCSLPCAAQARGRKRRSRVILKCECCGKKFEVVTSRSRARFCCRKCAQRGWTGHRKPEEECSKIVVKCAFCGKEKRIWKAWRRRNRNGQNFFCSIECKARYHSENHVGDKASNWRGGKSFEPYPIGWRTAFKERIRDRDGRVCRKCGKTEEENGRRMDIHHIDGNKDNLDEANLISLCCRCHPHKRENKV